MITQPTSIVSINNHNYEKTSIHKLTKNVIEIIEPLKKIGIIYFSYAEIIDSRYFRGLVSNDDIARAFIKDNGLQKEISLSPSKILKPGFYPSSSLINITKSKMIKDYYEERLQISGTTDVIIAIKDQRNIRKVYAFGLLNSQYINCDYLEMFISYFDDKAYDLINQSDKIKIPREVREYCFLLDPSCEKFICTSKQTEEEFLNNINAKYYKIKKLQEKYFLSHREKQCLELILQNKLIKEIAYSLHLSVRTIEAYINNLKRKLDCNTKNEIVLRCTNQTYI